MFKISLIKEKNGREERVIVNDKYKPAEKTHDYFTKQKQRQENAYPIKMPDMVVAIIKWDYCTDTKYLMDSSFHSQNRKCTCVWKYFC